MSPAIKHDHARFASPAWWQRAKDRLARHAWQVLLVSVALALIGGLVDAAGLLPDTGNAQVGVPCENPPCFGGDGLPSLDSLTTVLPMLGYLLAIVLSLPSLLVGIYDLLRARWAAGASRLLTFAGPVLFFVGTEIVPHLVNPCFWAWQLGGMRLSKHYCTYSPEWGADVADRWHLLMHTVAGAIPMAALYWLALRKWRPDITR